jgi:HlyD family secretion protein
MERNLEMIRGKLSEMTIKAPISGELNSFDLEPGEVLQNNQTIARVDVPGKYCIRALVDQHYINRLRFGQKGSITFDGKSYELTIRKVLSTVENGQIELFMDFTSGFPENLRRGQSFQVRIETSGEKKAVKVPKGSFYQSSGGQFVYVVSDDGTKAIKQTVEIGRQNPDFYEVVGGLAPGQKVIISSYTSYKDNEQIRLIKN